MPQIHLDDETVERLDALRTDGEEYDDLVRELIVGRDADVRPSVENSTNGDDA
ncbi:DUF7557 family protein [Halorubrum sp. SY-15]|jgi:hypothetical protein|uniref:DUF7557 family protein n=1 Tax=Halorubrum sp. SY-15 TaxID=3402277 RepID=UPI003EBE18C4